MNKYTVINRSLRRKSKKTNKRAELTLVKYNCFVNLFRSRKELKKRADFVFRNENVTLNHFFDF